VIVEDNDSRQGANGIVGLRTPVAVRESGKDVPRGVVGGHAAHVVVIGLDNRKPGRAPGGGIVINLTQTS
jgi:hypothetical protein